MPVTKSAVRTYRVPDAQLGYLGTLPSGPQPPCGGRRSQQVTGARNLSPLPPGVLPRSPRTYLGAQSGRERGAGAPSTGRRPPGPRGRACRRRAERAPWQGTGGSLGPAGRGRPGQPPKRVRSQRSTASGWAEAGAPPRPRAAVRGTAPEVARERRVSR